MGKPFKFRPNRDALSAGMTNSKRARRAGLAAALHSGDATMGGDAVRDLLSDLMHYCDSTKTLNGTFDELLATARANYMEER